MILSSYSWTIFFTLFVGFGIGLFVEENGMSLCY